MGATANQRRAELIARVVLTVAALLPYWPLLTLAVVFVTDDFFTSDIFNGELPGRVLIGEMIRQGELPIWTNRLCSGVLLAGVSEPLGLASFTALPPAVALDLFLIVMLLVAAHGAYALARRLGADRPSAVLAGVAFAGSGYFAAQLKHLAIISTVVWLPAGLVCLDRAFDAREDVEPTLFRRMFYVGGFGLIVAEQVLAGFPQSAYISGLVYGAFTLFRAWGTRDRWGSLRLPLGLMAASGVAVAFAVAAGAVSWLPLSELGTTSDRREPLGWMWSTMVPYWPRNGLTFLAPYINGDVSDNTYRGPSLFWEDYGYVGVATFLLALYGAREWRRPLVGFTAAMTAVSYLMVLGRSSYVYWLAYLIVPGISTFRFPTRFLIVVDLGLALLAAVGLTKLGAELERRWGTTMPTVPRLVVLGLCAFTVADLFVHQPRQNPMVAAETWLQPPVTVQRVKANGGEPRTFTVQHGDLHRATFRKARGWADVTPYYELRDVLQPNLGGAYWNTPSVDCYTGIAPTWYVDVWGDHNRPGMLAGRLAGLTFKTGTLNVHPGVAKVLGAYGVTHMLSPYPAAAEAALPSPSQDGQAHVYPIAGTARVRVVSAARHVASNEEATERLLHDAFDPNREVLLHDAPPWIAPTVSAGAPVVSGQARIVAERSREVVVEASADTDAFLLLADTFYPGWTADVDGQRVPLYRANISVRGIQLPKGQHRVRFAYDAGTYLRGLALTIVALSCLVLWTGASWALDRRARRQADLG